MSSLGLWVRRMGLVVVAASFTAAGTTRLLWGYWHVPPTLMQANADLVRIGWLAAGESASAFLKGEERMSAISRAVRNCEVRSGTCVEGRALLAAQGDPLSTPDFASHEAEQAWAAVLNSTEASRLTAPTAFNTLVQSGYVLLAATGPTKAQTILVGVRTKEIGPDRQAYLECSISVGSERPNACINYEFEISGFEFLTFPVLLVASLMFWGAVMLVSIWARRTLNAETPRSGAS